MWLQRWPRNVAEFNFVVSLSQFNSGRNLKLTQLPNLIQWNRKETLKGESEKIPGLT